MGIMGILKNLLLSLIIKAEQVKYMPGEVWEKFIVNFG